MKTTAPPATVAELTGEARACVSRFKGDAITLAEVRKLYHRHTGRMIADDVEAVRHTDGHRLMGRTLSAIITDLSLIAAQSAGATLAEAETILQGGHVSRVPYVARLAYLNNAR